MDDDTLALLSDLDILLSDSDHHIPQTVCEDTGQVVDDYCSISYIYGDFTAVQPLQPHPHTPLPVYSKNNNASSIEIEEPWVRKRERHDKGSAGNVTKVAVGEGADKEKAAEKEDEDRPKRRRTAEQHSVYERKRRSRIQERLRTLQEMVPNASKLTKSSMLDETIKHIKGLQLHLQMMKEHGLGFLSQCMEIGKIQKMKSSQYHNSTCIPMRSPSEVGYAHGHGHGTSFYQPISPDQDHEGGGGGGGWPQMSATGVFPYYYDYPPEPLFPAADGSPLPPVVTAEVSAHVSPSNHQPVVPAEVLARLSTSNHLPVLRQVSPANQGQAINFYGPIMPNVQQIPRTAQEFFSLINVPEPLGEASTYYGGSSVDHNYDLGGFGQTHPQN